MKTLIATVLIITILAPAALFAQPVPVPVPSSSVNRNALVPYADGSQSSGDSYNEGVMDAEDQHSAFGWGVGGFFAGGLFSWLGTGIVVLVASGSRPTPRYVPDAMDTMSYRNGYTDEARRQNVRSAAIPGVIMSALWTFLVVSASSQY